MALPIYSYIRHCGYSVRRSVTIATFIQQISYNAWASLNRVLTQPTHPGSLSLLIHSSGSFFYQPQNVAYQGACMGAALEYEQRPSKTVSQLQLHSNCSFTSAKSSNSVHVIDNQSQLWPAEYVRACTWLSRSKTPPHCLPDAVDITYVERQASTLVRD